MKKIFDHQSVGINERNKFEFWFFLFSRGGKLQVECCTWAYKPGVERNNDCNYVRDDTD